MHRSDVVPVVEYVGNQTGDFLVCLIDWRLLFANDIVIIQESSGSQEINATLPRHFLVDAEAM